MKSLAALALALSVAACGGGDTATGATCPTADPPTYASFGQAFFGKYCTSCHSAQSTNRHDAPGNHNYDSEADIRRHADAIDEVAAAGPDATNTSMPAIGGTVTSKPTDAERALLGQYLACLAK
ncbi:MAG TPA: c-type cytochrome [Kofleriaceae bacterium]|nr:c-type cytochrome [Kofleriaceae bacterium]